MVVSLLSRGRGGCWRVVERGGRRGRWGSSACEGGERVLREGGGDGSYRGRDGRSFGDGFLALSIVFELVEKRRERKERGGGKEGSTSEGGGQLESFSLSYCHKS